MDVAEKPKWKFVAERILPAVDEMLVEFGPRVVADGLLTMACYSAIKYMMAKRVDFSEEMIIAESDALWRELMKAVDAAVKKHACTDGRN